jgi:hypothetical protein
MAGMKDLEPGAVVDSRMHSRSRSRSVRVKPQSRTRSVRLPDHGLAWPVYISPMLYAMDQNDLLVLEDLIDDPVVAAPS